MGTLSSPVKLLLSGCSQQRVVVILISTFAQPQANLGKIMPHYLELRAAIELIELKFYR